MQEGMALLIERAAVLYGNTESAPTHPDPDTEISRKGIYSLRRALLDAGADRTAADSLHMQYWLADRIQKKFGGRVLPAGNDIAEMKKRFQNVLDIFEYVSKNISHRTFPKQGVMMRQVGFSGQDLKPGANYQFCKRLRDKAAKRVKEAKQATGSSIRSALLDTEDGGEVVRGGIAGDDGRRIPRPAPITTEPPASISMARRPLRSRSSGDLLSPSSLLTDDLTWIPRDDPSIMGESSPREFHGGESLASAKSLFSVEKSKTTRQTSKQKQQERKEIQRIRVTKSLAFKFATAWYEAAQKHEIDILTEPEEIAEFFNEAFSLGKGISVTEITRAYKNRTCDERLPLSIRNGRLDDDVYELLCDALWTMNALEQRNVCAERLTIADEKKLLNNIVNGKIAEDNKLKPIEYHEKPVDIERLHHQIATSNSLKQDIKQVDERDFRRVQWCTYDNQLKHYKASERALVERGYARYPVNEEERSKHGFVVFHPGQKNRYVNIGVVRVSFDRGSEQAGGRSSMTHSNSGIREGGKVASGSEDTCTLLMGIVGDEPMPYLVILPSSASEEGNARINSDFFLKSHQIFAKYGYQQKRWHDPTFTTSPDGRMTGKILSNWTMELKALFPDLSDTPGKRVFLKADTGPEFEYFEYLLKSRLLGIDHFPGLPNGTEVGQEMDRLFSTFKKDLYLNRDKLCLWRGGKINKLDLGLMIHGGVVKDPNDPNRTLRLVNAFEKNFTAEKIRAARFQCGYCPATRNGLHDAKIRLVVDGEEIEQASDPQLQLVLDAERINHEAVKALVKKGYKFAHELKRFATGLEDQFELDDDVRTEPNTPEQFFRITGGGAVYNCRDVLLARAQKAMGLGFKEAEKEKKRIVKWHDVVKQSFLSEIKGVLDERKYRNVDLRNMIKYLMGPKEFESQRLNGFDRNGLLLKWKELKKQNGRFLKAVWTDDDERRLQRLARCELDSYEETAVETIREYDVARVRSLSTASWKFVMNGILQDLSPERKEFLAKVISSNFDFEAFVDDESDLMSCEIDSLISHRAPSIAVDTGSDASSGSSQPSDESLNVSNGEDDDSYRSTILVDHESDAEESPGLDSNPVDGECYDEKLILSKEHNPIERGEREMEHADTTQSTDDTPIRPMIGEGKYRDKDRRELEQERSKLEFMPGRSKRLRNLQEKDEAEYDEEDFKFLMESRTAKWGNAKRKEVLRKKWKANENKPVVWDDPPLEELESELEQVKKHLGNLNI